jgi:hypothetical protein
MPSQLTDDQLEARQQLRDARLAHRDRKRDTRRKVIAGAVALAHAGHDGEFRGQLCRLLAQHVTRPHDRALFADLLDG